MNLVDIYENSLLFYFILLNNTSLYFTAWKYKSFYKFLDGKIKILTQKAMLLSILITLNS